jgi:hypothetical protein
MGLKNTRGFLVEREKESLRIFRARHVAGERMVRKELVELHALNQSRSESAQSEARSVVKLVFLKPFEQLAGIKST